MFAPAKAKPLLQEWHSCRWKLMETPVTLSLGNLFSICRLLKNHSISFGKDWFIIIANYSSTVPLSPKMLLREQCCFDIKEHRASWRCHGASHTSIFLWKWLLCSLQLHLNMLVLSSVLYTVQKDIIESNKIFLPPTVPESMLLFLELSF